MNKPSYYTCVLMCGYNTSYSSRLLTDYWLLTWHSINSLNMDSFIHTDKHKAPW